MLKIKLVKSLIASLPEQRKTIQALGLRKLQSEVLKKDSPQIRGMIKKVAHLVTVSEVEEK